MTDHDEFGTDDLGTRLREAAEGLPDNPQRFEAVAGRVRHRRRSALAVAAAIVLVSVTGTAVALGRAVSPDGSSHLATTSGSPTPRATSSAPPTGPSLRCPAAEPALSPPESAAGRSGPLVPGNGVVSALVCVRGPGPHGADDHPVLTAARARQLVQRLNRLGALDPSRPCTMELGRTYDVVLGYADGRRVTVTFEAYGCGIARQGEQYRMGAGRELGEQVTRLAEEQRLERAAQDIRLTCRPDAALSPRTGTLDPAPVDDSLLERAEPAPPHPAVAARLCRYDRGGGLAEQKALGAVEAERLRRAFVAAGSQGPGCTGPSGASGSSGPIDIVVFADRAGGRYELAVLRAECLLVIGAETRGAATERILDGIDGVLGRRPS